MTAPLVRLRGLAKRFGDRPALSGIDLELDRPEIVAVVGPDGAGKTTLLRSLAGLLEIEAEEASVLGHDLRGDVTELKRRIGYVPQSFGLHATLSIAENLAFTARLHRLPRAEADRRSEALLARTALAPFADREAGALSGGMKQKLSIANALLPEPDLLVLDEPTAGVDIVARHEIWSILVEARARALVVLATSYLDEADAADRVVYLDAGRVVADGAPAALRARTPRHLYRLWADDAPAAAHAAARLPWVVAARAVGRFARVEVRTADAPPDAGDRLRALPDGTIRLAERAPADMEAALHWFAAGELA